MIGTPGSTPTPPGEPETRGTGMWQRLAPEHVDWVSLVVVPLLAVFSALVIGALLIVVTEGADEVWPAFKALFSGAFVGWASISETLLNAAPLILAGLAVAIGFQAGLFNIGVEGQMTIGGLTAVIAGFSITGLPLVIHLPVAVMAGILGGAIWGGIPGLLRAKTGAHEVITTIMLNFVAYRLLDYLLKTPFIQRPDRFDPISKVVEASARFPKLLGWLPVPGAPGLRLHMGFILALLTAWFIYWLLYRSSLGFEYRMVGANPGGARYAGVSVTWSIVSVMAISGGLGGMAGANETLGILGTVTPGFTSGIGFDAIALALLGRSHPAGVVLSGVLFGALRAGGRTMQSQSAVGIDLITIVQALIIVFIAAPALVRAVYRVKAADAGTEQITRGWST